MDFILKIENLSKKYGNQLSLNELSLELKSGEIVGLLGPNGAGKSTLMKILTGFLKPHSGEIYINNLSYTSHLKQLQHLIGYLPENNPLYTEMYVKEYLQFCAAIYAVNKKQIEFVIEQVGLTAEAHKKIHQLSKGYRQRVGLAAALLHNPSILILDEPTTGLDPNQLDEIRLLIKKLGKDKIVLLSSHILQEIEAVCDRVIILHKGTIIQDMNLKEFPSTELQIIEVEFDVIINEKLLKDLPLLYQTTQITLNTWEISFNTTNDMRPVLVDFAQKNAIRCLKIQQKSNKLADLFKELTAN